MVRHFLTLKDISVDELKTILELAADIKESPEKYEEKMRNKTLLMIFEKPSLRTRVSFETGMTRMGGHAIFYSIKDSPLGKKESISDTAKTASRFVDIIMARLYKHSDIEELAENSSVPVINALTDFTHPCQIVADLFTIKEKFGELKGLKLAYVGDSNNNVTHSLLYGCAMAGLNINVAFPDYPEFRPDSTVVKEAKQIAEENGCVVKLFNSAEEAVKGANIIYTDSWMSYHIPKEEEEERAEKLAPFRVTSALMSRAAENAVFMHCLPASRKQEVASEVIDGAKSIVFDQAENRMHAQNALMLTLLNNTGE